MLDLITYLAVMILVQRAYGPAGLGVFAYLTSLLLISAFLSEFGIPRFVEVSVGRRPRNLDAILTDGHRAILAGTAICALVMLFGIVYAREATRIEDRLIIYVLAMPCVLFKNLNSLRFAALHGSGEHGRANRLKAMNRLAFLAAVYLLQLIRVPPAWLMGAFLIGDAWTCFRGRKTLRLPRLRRMGTGTPLKEVFTRSRRHILTDDALDVVFYADFLILGVFVSSADLGVYAQALILVRMFLILPVGVQPILREKYLARAEAHRLAASFDRVRFATRVVFAVQALLALYALDFFPEILSGVLRSQHRLPISFRCFEMILPGLMLFSPLIILEPVYEAIDRMESFRALALFVAAANLGLNIYLVPYAGITGAAAATSLSMFIYFIGFGREFRADIAPLKKDFWYAGAAVYLVFILSRHSGLGGLARFILLPAVWMAMLKLIAFFNPDNRKMPEST